MFDDTIDRRVRPLAEAFAQSDLRRVTISDGEFELELARGVLRAHGSPGASGEPAAAVKPLGHDYDVVKADLVGIVHLSRPVVSEGTVLEGDREIAFGEALGIRNPVRSKGSGRVAIVYIEDGQPVEYGQPLFAIDRD